MKLTVRRWGMTCLGFLCIVILGSVSSVCATGETVVIDLNKEQQAIQHRACNFLWGFSRDDALNPPDEFVTPLKISLSRMNAFYTVGQYTRLSALGIQQIAVLSDLWNKSLSLPGDNGEWSGWEERITDYINRDVSAGITPVYDIWNEPDHPDHLGSRPRTQYYELWKRTYDIIKVLHPNAEIEGPEFYSIFPGGVNGEQFEDFLLWAKANNCLPDYIAWHFAQNAPEEAAYLRQFCKDNQIAYKGLRVSEYVPSNQQHPGKAAWFIAQMERAQVDALHAIWSETGKTDINTGTLADILAVNDGVYSPRGQWWAYKRYSEMSGNIVYTENSSNIDMVATTDKERNIAQILFGHKGSGDSKYNMRANIVVHGIPQISMQDTVRITLERIPQNDDDDDDTTLSPAVEELPAATEFYVPVVDGSIALDFLWTDYHDAYYMTITSAITETTELYNSKDMTQVKNLNGLTDFSIVTNITNHLSKGASVTSVAALYDENDVLIDIKTDSQNIEEKSNAFFRPSMSIPNTDQAYTLKVFLWDQTHSLIPLFKAQKYEYEDFLVTIGGKTYEGQGQRITIKVIQKNDGRIVFIDQVISGKNGEYLFDFHMPGYCARNEYTIKIASERVDSKSGDFTFEDMSQTLLEMNFNLGGE